MLVANDFVTKDTVLILRNAGPVGAPGMPEWGQLPIPKKLIMQGIRDMVRLSDCRMSGTSYGACVLHIAPESAVGGPLALVKNGDMIRLDVAKRRIDLLVDGAKNRFSGRIEHLDPHAVAEAHEARARPAVGDRFETALLGEAARTGAAVDVGDRARADDRAGLQFARLCRVGEPW
mgnify:CR=1 FL=1